MTTMTAEAQLKAGVRRALEELRATFSGLRVDVLPSACGGAFVRVEDVPLGAPFRQATTWIGFFLSSACPDDDVYPLYLRGDLSRSDQAALTSPLHINQQWPAVEGMDTRAAVMVSRRQNNQSCWSIETPSLKLRTVIRWLKSL